MKIRSGSDIIETNEMTQKNASVSKDLFNVREKVTTAWGALALHGPQ